MGNGERKPAVMNAQAGGASCSIDSRPPRPFSVPLPALTWWQRYSLRIRKPPWVKGDDLQRFFRDYPYLLRHGRVVWGHVVQANQMLFKSGPYDSGADVVYCADARSKVAAKTLAAVAGELFSLKGTEPADARQRKIADHLTNERHRAFGLPVPTSMSNGYDLRISTVFICRGHLPERILSQSFFPLLISDDRPGSAMILPSQLWPEELLDLWLPVAKRASNLAGRSDSTEHGRPPKDPDGLLRLLNSPIEPVRPRPLYTVGLGLVTAIMLLLPLAYISLILLAGYGMYYHAANNVGFLMAPGENTRGRAFAYIAPLAVGATLILFMLKPLVAPRARDGSSHHLKRDEEPLLFCYVDRLCSAVGAPKPCRIEVDCQANASASLQSMWRGVFFGNLTLTIGLPLARGLTLRQFTGVLAHELGHFSQGTGMRMTFIVRSVNSWLARVVFERDAWDDSIETQIRSGSGQVVMIATLVKGTVWFTRRILWLFMMAGHLVSCFMLRQMEFDADCYEARVCGATAFAQTMDRCECLSAASAEAMASLIVDLSEHRLCEDLPMLISRCDRQMPRDQRHMLLRSMYDKRSELLSTHPSAADRIRWAAKESRDGIQLPELPATVLFADLLKLSKEATTRFYERLLGSQLQNDTDEAKLRAMEEMAL